MGSNLVANVNLSDNLHPVSYKDPDFIVFIKKFLRNYYLNLNKLRAELFIAPSMLAQVLIYLVFGSLINGRITHSPHK